jgi:hypothetical protein
VERHVGQVSDVFHEPLSTRLHLDVLQVAPTEERPYRTLVTCGMSSLAMNAPKAQDARAELLLCLPADWPLDEESLEDERNHWPIRLLKDLARLPHEHDTWLGFGHTIPNGDPPEPYAPGTELCGAVVVPPVRAPKEVRVLDQEQSTTFYAVVALHADELELRRRHGLEALFEPFDKAGVSEVLDPRRPSALRRRRRFGLF